MTPLLKITADSTRPLYHISLFFYITREESEREREGEREGDRERERERERER